MGPQPIQRLAWLQSSLHRMPRESKRRKSSWCWMQEKMQGHEDNDCSQVMHRMIWWWLSGDFGFYTLKHTKLTLCSTKTPPNSTLMIRILLDNYFHLMIPWIYYLV